MEWDSVRAFEEQLKNQEDNEKTKMQAGNHVGVKNGELLKGEHNSYGPAFRYGASAPRLGESNRPLRMLEERKTEAWALVYAGPPLGWKGDGAEK